ncbi:MAG: hypothetical protein NTV08_14970 [Verrucomicrobia bacterium]|nr:hypothetical protein [Verrucomicrobiota bacterium]
MGLDGVELVMAFEEAFGISIPNADAQKMLTPQAVIDFVASHRGKNSSIHSTDKFPRADIAGTVKHLVIEHLGLNESDYAADKEFVRDFGVD